MLVWIFGVLVVLAFAFLALGYSTDADAFKTIGYAILIFAFGGFLFSGITFPQGYTTTTTDNISVTEPSFITYENHTLAFLLTIASFIGVVFVMVERNQ